MKRRRGPYLGGDDGSRRIEVADGEGIYLRVWPEPADLLDRSRLRLLDRLGVLLTVGDLNE
jgi:hypothetical protein